MSFVLSERTKEISESTGTGTILLGGSFAGFQTFIQAIGAGNTTFYCIEDNTTDQWEVGWGTVLSGPARLQRDVVYKSSNANLLVDFASGIHTVFCAPSAHKAVVYPPDSFDLTLSGSLTVPFNTTILGNLRVINSGSFGTVTASEFKGSGAQITGVLTASYTPSAVTASYANSASAATHAVQADSATTASFASIVPAAGITAGTMSGNFFINGNVQIPGTASIGQLVTIYTSSSIIYQSGSTKFGDSLDDTHQFTGSMLVNGPSNLNGPLTASTFKGDGTQITGVVTASYAGTDWFAINRTPTVVSASSQILYASMSGIPVGLVSSSLQISTGSFIGSFSGSVTGALFLTSPSIAIVSGTSLVLDYASLSGPNTVLEGRRGGVARWGIGFSAADVFAILNAAKTVPNFVMTDGGNVSVEGTIFSTGSITTRTNLTVLGTGSVGLFTDITSSAFKGVGSQITGVISSSYAGTASFSNSDFIIGTTGAGNIKLRNFNGSAYLNLDNADPELSNGASGRSIYLSGDNFVFRGGTKASTTIMVTGSLALSGSSSTIVGDLTASAFKGVGSQITGVISASYAGTDWFVINRIPVGLISSSTQINTGSFQGSFSGSLSGSHLGGFTGSLLGSASYAPTDWFVINRIPVGLISSSVQINTGSFSGGFTGSLLGSSSYALTSSAATSLTFIPLSASYAITSSYASVAQILLGSVTSASYASTASLAITASAANSLTFRPYTFLSPNVPERNFVVASPWVTIPSAGSGSSFSWQEAVWAPSLGLFCAVSSTDPTIQKKIFQTSPDGLNWTLQTGSLSKSLNAIAWSPELSLFCAAGTSLDSQSIQTSPNGRNWTTRNASTSSADGQTIWTGIAWSPELRLFAAVATQASHSMTSPDGINWTTQNISADSYQTICWSPQLKLFCAVADNGLTNSAITSPDGITWTKRALSGGSGFWTSVCWSPELSIFCAVDRGQNASATSPDGITWTTGTMPAAHWNSVCWSPQLGVFIAVAETPGIAYSLDGLTWSSVSAPTGNWNNIVWSAELGVFAGAAYASTNGIMYSVGAYGQTLISGSTRIVGANVTGSFIGTFSGSFSGSLLGTASLATTASYATTAQTLLGSVTSASFAATSSYVTALDFGGGATVGTSASVPWFATGALYPLGRSGAGNTEYTFNQNNVSYTPFTVGRDITVDRLTINVSTAANGAAKAKLALYDADPITFGPRTQLVATGDLSIFVAGEKSGSITAQPLKKGALYFVAMVSSGTGGGCNGIPALNCAIGPSIFGTVTGGSFDGSGGKTYVFESIGAGSYTFPSTAAPTGGNATQAPQIWIRISA